jgi:hypothetical protein
MVMVKIIFKIFIFIFVAFGCTRSFNQEEAIRSLKVLNSDMANMLLTAGEMPEMAALRYLWNQPTAPLPFPNEKFISISHISATILRKQRVFINGIHCPPVLSSNRRANQYLSLFSGVGFHNANFRITGFESQPISSRPDFPIFMDAAMFIDNQQYMQVKHTATIEDELPLNINTNISGREITKSLEHLTAPVQATQAPLLRNSL